MLSLLCRFAACLLHRRWGGGCSSIVLPGCCQPEVPVSLSCRVLCHFASDTPISIFEAMCMFGKLVNACLATLNSQLGWIFHSKSKCQIVTSAF